MSIRIVNPNKQKVLEQDGSKFFYIYPIRETVYDCYYKVLGSDFDLSRIKEDSITLNQMSDIITEICKQAITDWDNVLDENDEPINFDVELIAYLPIKIKTEIFNKVMGFLALMLGTENMVKKSVQHTPKNSQKSGRNRKTTKKP